MTAKRLFDGIVSASLLIATSPLLLIAATMIRLDSPGPVVYRSRRIGKNGRSFGMLRFRTVDVHKPAHLSMHERMTRAGRFIRNYSIDDLPNLFNVLKGDMSIVGPRPTEPEHVDLEDPDWQRILTVRPGLLSFAIHRLAKQYNTSSWTLRKKLELEYVQRQSLTFDLQILWEATRALIASRGNIKARGEPSVEIEDDHSVP